MLPLDTKPPYEQAQSFTGEPMGEPAIEPKVPLYVCLGCVGMAYGLGIISVLLTYLLCFR